MEMFLTCDEKVAEITVMYSDLGLCQRFLGLRGLARLPLSRAPTTHTPHRRRHTAGRTAVKKDRRGRVGDTAELAQLALKWQK